MPAITITISEKQQQALEAIIESTPTPPYGGDALKLDQMFTRFVGDLARVLGTPYTPDGTSDAPDHSPMISWCGRQWGGVSDQGTGKSNYSADMFSLAGDVGEVVFKALAETVNEQRQLATEKEAHYLALLTKNRTLEKLLDEARQHRCDESALEEFFETMKCLDIRLLSLREPTSMTDNLKGVIHHCGSSTARVVAKHLVQLSDIPIAKDGKQVIRETLRTRTVETLLAISAGEYATDPAAREST